MRRRTLVTRALEQASPLVKALRAAGCEPVVVPAIAIVEPEDFAAMDAALAELAGFDWVVFTSANGVEAFARRLVLGLRAMPSAQDDKIMAKIAAIGPATARAVEAAGMRVGLVPEVAVGESLAAALVAEVARGARRFLLVRAEVAREVVPAALRAAGAEVVEVAAYRTVVPAESVARVRAIFADRAAWPEVAVFTSGSTAVNLAALLREAGVALPEQVRCVSMGPITSAALREMGWRVDAEARETTVAALVAAVVRVLRDK